MSVYRIRKSFTFEAAHQLENAFTRECYECVHGHSYTVEMVVSCAKLDKDGMVLDFGELAEFKKKVMEEWDHGLLLHENKRIHYQPLIDARVLKREKVTFFSVNPTAENLARALYSKLREFLNVRFRTPGNEPNDRKVQVQAIRVHETSTGWAEVGE